MAKNLIISGKIDARCACGQWHYRGSSITLRQEIMAEHQSHLWSCPLEQKEPPAKKRRR